jgi:hypothetical protein
MAIRDKITANVQPHLQPGETIQAVFAGQTHSPYWVLITYFMLFRVQYRVLVATDQRIMVCQSGRVSTTKVKAVLANLPRHTKIGPPSGLWWRSESLGSRIYIHRRFHGDVRHADSLASPAGR